jgi:hypothetical protein
VLLTECASASTAADLTVRTSYGLLRSYKPRAIRTTTILIMIILSCGLIASLDVTRCSLSSRDVPSSPSPNNSTDSRKRQLSATTGTTLFSSYDSSGFSSLSGVSTRSGSPTATVSGVWTLPQTDGASTLSASSQAQPSTLVSGPTGTSYVNINGTLWMATSSASQTESSSGAAPEGEYLQFQDGYYGGFTGTDYFIGVYLPILVALIYASFWGVIDANVRRMEPLYQLARPEGAFAKDTLTFSYFSCNAFTTPIHALRRRHCGDRRYNLLTLSHDHTSSVEDSGKVTFPQSDLVMNTAAPNKPRLRSRRLGLLPIVAGIVLLGLMVFLIYYHQNGSDDAFEQFMDGQSIGVRVMMVMVGVVIKDFWQRTEQSESSKHFDKHFDDLGLIRDTGAQFCEPYMKLMDGPSHPRDTILMGVRSSPLECFFAAVRNRHAYLASIAFTSFCAEVLTILLPSIPFNNTETWQAY